MENINKIMKILLLIFLIAINWVIILYVLVKLIKIENRLLVGFIGLIMNYMLTSLVVFLYGKKYKHPEYAKFYEAQELGCQSVGLITVIFIIISGLLLRIMEKPKELFNDLRWVLYAVPIGLILLFLNWLSIPKCPKCGRKMIKGQLVDVDVTNPVSTKLTYEYFCPNCRTKK